MTMGRVLSALLCLAALAWATGVVRAAEPLFRPRTLLGGEYWGTMPEPGYLDYLEAVKPDLMHGAVLGPELAGSVYGKGTLKGITPVYPSDVSTMREYLAWWKTFNAEAHKRGVKVQATFSMTLTWGDREKNAGFFKYYRDLWETDLLGPKPAPTPEALLAVNSTGAVIEDKYGNWLQYRGCLNNPDWRTMLKSMVKTGVDAGFDGFMVQFPYFDSRCVCPHCQEKFRAFLAARFTKEALAAECGIADLATHRFTVIGDPEKKYRKLDLAAREFGAICVKDCFDDVFVNYGRTLKPGLVLSMWTHFRNFLSEDATNTEFDKYTDERMLLPIERWGQGENYLWYSSPVYTSNLAKGIVGDCALDGRVLRAMANGTPFEVLKYDYFRWRLITAESWAHGGICFGAWKGGWSGGQDREQPHHLRGYYQFSRDNDQYLNPAKRQSYADLGMIYPRQALFAGDATFFETFRKVGRILVSMHLLFDVIIDQRMTAADLARHQGVIAVAPQYLTEAQVKLLDDYAKTGGKVVAVAQPADQAKWVARGWQVIGPTLFDPQPVQQPDNALPFVAPSTFKAPWTVEVLADRQVKEKRVLVHFVNYDRDESQNGKELPTAAEPVTANLRLPDGLTVERVTFLTPEVKGVQTLTFTRQQQHVTFTTPGFLVYGLAVVQCK